MLIIKDISAQHVYKDRKFFGGYLYFNSDALKDVLVDDENKNNLGQEYWNNTPFDTTESKDISIKAKVRANIVYGYFPINNLAIGGEFNISSNSFNEELDSLFFISNKSFDITTGPFIKYYIEIGRQPYEIGAIFIETAYNIGLGWSEDNLSILMEDSSWTQSESYQSSLSVIKTKVGFSWYLSDFLSHNWFTGALLCLEPSISYDWKTNTYLDENIKRKSRGFTFNIALISYL